jgi:lysyl-tRNA synthetase, class II
VSDEQPTAYDDLPELLRVRREKLDRLRASGVDPYPAGFPRTTTISDLRAAYPGRHCRPGDAVAGGGQALLRDPA